MIYYLERVLVYGRETDVDGRSVRLLLRGLNGDDVRGAGVSDLVLRHDPEVVGGGRPEAEHPGDGLVPADQDPVDVVMPRALGQLVLDHVVGQVGVALVRSLPGQLNVAAILV